ncbi:hypothetical protein CPIN17260_0033 [Campylobacter pinnipediorum subsp. pinnipediorum]|uniref:Uncharacterized protein n=1 Tax=Campylobacter pinnipediorum subsp. pinnipediorum TaxID=1660067 RepID=A0AAX0LC37_9BACT|nr:hypothetical protein [Campylobacter pinnipediorum]AQW80393.1 hypothetical protein CPIN17260_0033 [Campylobacter pinnipediorum subsp. pinnipediorum]OPA81972.1 hypothetical protein BFG04_08200 [Campylobacter pinnipediorum subsp. pinnipediorum]
MLIEFLNFLGLNDKTTHKKQPTHMNDASVKEKAEEYIVQMQSPYFKEEITTKTIIKDGKKIEIKKIKTAEPLNNGKTLVSIKTYKKDITRM